VSSVTEETRELAIAPVREALIALIARRRPERADLEAAFAAAYVRRLSSDAARAVPVETLYAELHGAFRLLAGRGERPAAVRAFNPSLERDGYEAGGTVVETNTADLPFLLDSVSALLEARGARIARVQHPIIGTEREDGGALTAILHPREGGARESVMHFELDRHLPDAELEGLADEVRSVLGDVRRAVLDHPVMLDRARRMIHLATDAGRRYDDDEIDETVAFLDWLQADHFIFLGYREYRIADEAIAVVPGSGLGILADEASSAFARPRPFASLPPDVVARAIGGDLLVVTKTNRVSTVRRRRRLDYIAVRRIGPDGEVIGEARMLGLFSTRAYTEPASDTPLLNRKLRQILRHEDLIEGSHDYKAAVALFNSFPKDELFAAPADSLRRAVVALMLIEGDRVRILGRRSADGRSMSLIATLPADRYDQDVLDGLVGLVRHRYATDAVDTRPVLGEGGRVFVHLSVHRPDGVPEPSVRELEQGLVSLTRSWEDGLRERLLDAVGPSRGTDLVARWGERLPDAYKAAVAPAVAVGDVLALDRLDREGTTFTVGLHNEGDRTRLALYTRGARIELGELLPSLEDLGLRVIEEVPTRLADVETDGDHEHWIQDFGVQGADGRPLDLAEVGERVAACLTAVWRRETESDSLNRLVVTAGLDWDRIAILRAYRMYRARVGSRFTQDYQNDVLVANAPITALLGRYFDLRFDPARPRDEAAEEALRGEILAALDEVASLDHDRILRGQLQLVDATVRTNAYVPGRTVTTFKLRSADVPEMPRPAPLWEIYVYSPELEGIHLRAGEVARGGLRWSDRQDYRTEVYGLMRAQVTKNAVIVPAGAKGGFYLKAPPEDPAALRGEVERQYRRFVAALLELTDDLQGGEAVHPAHVRVLDGDDAYLVVAADKGTATFSDLANEIAETRGYWLGDAFASGGRTGYDHKALGITARGAWESVRRHFRELSVDPEAEEITVVGIGDMSGDVFGNGLLRSRTLRLIGAYDHRHVFLDPSPDAAASHAERARLYALPRSSWDDYDRSLISPGGGVWPRTAKSIPISPEARAALGIEDERLAPNDLIRAILRAPVDLLWNGGIGTVVKASTETDADAQDRASDAVRVDARDLRARVVGEGGNLGLTRRARVEFSVGGGLVNADFIDNSAGVDCSDHEVNLKILLGLAERRGELDRPGRDELLRSVTDDVTAHVLYDSFLQAQILAQEVRDAAGRLYAYEDLMADVEEAGLLDRGAEALPSSEEMVDRRRNGRGLERPELALLLAYAKQHLARELLASPLPDDPWFQGDLREYFPDPVVDRFGHLLAEHPLRRELLVTIIANDIVDSMGPTFVSQLAAERGARPSQVARAYRIARHATGARARWAAIERLPATLDRGLQHELKLAVDRLVDTVTRWSISHPPAGRLEEIADVAAAPFARLVAALPELGSEEHQAARRERADALEAAGVPAEVAWAHVVADELMLGPDVILVAERTGRDVEAVARAFQRVGDRLDIVRLLRDVDGLPQQARTQRWAAQAVREDVTEAWRVLAEAALEDGATTIASPEAAVDAYLDRRGALSRRLAAVTAVESIEGPRELSALLLAARALRALAD
jgi:glutamate dehydrogenase